jgi:nitrate reductase (cytochrome), electron transfer subunit
MSRPHPAPPGTLRRVLLIGVAAGLMVVGLLTLSPLVGRDTGPGGGDAVGTLEAGPPIAAEAEVFRTRPADLALGGEVARRPAVHPRNLAMFRSLRAYPGAPPFVPHGLTAEEYRTTGCNACHERGGYVERFASYAPVTPHPELVDCLQCHLPRDAVVGVPFPDRRANAVCLQCHVLDAPLPTFAPIDWPAPRWPAIGQAALPGGPPPIPHHLQLRGNCLTCHMAPAGVEEIRTTHPERSDCRQCHLAVGPEAGALEGSPPAAASTDGVRP